MELAPLLRFAARFCADFVDARFELPPRFDDRLREVLEPLVAERELDAREVEEPWLLEVERELVAYFRPCDDLARELDRLLEDALMRAPPLLFSP